MSFLFLLLFKMVTLYFWLFLAFCFQLGWQGLHHYVIHLLLPQKLCMDEFVKEVAITLLFIKTVAWLSPNPQIQYPKIINSNFILAFSPLQNIVIIILRPVLSKNKKTKIKKGNKGCQEIIGLIPFGKKMQDNCHASKCCGVMSPHRKKHQTHFLFVF